MRLDPKSLRMWNDALKNKQTEVIKEGQKALQKSALALEKSVVEKIYKENTNTGHYAQSIGQKGIDGYYKEKTLHIEIGTNVVYAPYIEFGTKPHFPPVKAIRQWVWLKRKDFGLKDNEVDGVAFAIAKRISKVGTKENLQWTRSIKEITPKFQAWFREGVIRGLNK
jgi:hypothetical protein